MNDTIHRMVTERMIAACSAARFPGTTLGGLMHDRASPSAPAASAGGRVLVPDVLEAVIRALAGALTPRAQPAQSAEPTEDRPLLDLEETADLLGVSRMTVARMADEGRLPSVVIRRGRVQKTRRIPRAFVDRIVADACAGAQVDMEEYTDAWFAEHASAQPPNEPGSQS